jgi:HK97 family phage portal protein
MNYTTTAIAGVHLLEESQGIQNQVVGGYEMLVDLTRRSDTGVVVNRDTSLDYAPIYYSVSKMAGHIGEMPKRVLLSTDDAVRPLTRQETPLVDLLNLTPNNFMSAMDMFETCQKDAVIDGNGRIGIIRDARGNPTTLILIHPAFAWSFLSYPDTSTQNTISDRSPYGPAFNAVQKWHYITSGQGDVIIIPDSDVIHIKGLQHDGLAGIPLWDTGKNIIGGGLAAEKHVNRTMRNNGIPGLILEAPEGVLTDKEKAQEFLNSFRKMHEGENNASKTALLRFGVKANQLSQSGRDGQLIENRKFSRDDAFLITGDMAFYDGGSAYSNQQDRDEAFKNNTMSRWRTKWESECNIKLLSDAQRMMGLSIDFDESSVLRGSLKQRLEAYEIAVRIGYFSQEEMRRRDGLPPPNPDENFATQSEPIDETTPPPEETESEGGTDGNEDEPANQLQTIEQPRIAGPSIKQLGANLHVSNWLKTERNKLLSFAQQPQTFVSSVDAFYQAYDAKISELSASVGCENWAESHKQQILDASECQPTELVQSIDNATKEWPTTRAAQLAGII